MGEQESVREELDVLAYYLEAMDLQMRECKIEPLFWSPLRTPAEMAAHARSVLNGSIEEDGKQ